MGPNFFCIVLRENEDKTQVLLNPWGPDYVSANYLQHNASRYITKQQILASTRVAISLHKVKLF